MMTVADLHKAMHKIAERKGDFTLLGLFLRANAPFPQPNEPGSWDLVASAPWLEGSRAKAIGLVIDLLDETVGKKKVRALRRVEVLPVDDPTTKFILRTVPVEDGEHFVQNLYLPTIHIERAIIFRAWKPTRKKPARKRLEPATAGSSRGRA
jgi:hypothetical protein